METYVIEEDIKAFGKVVAQFPSGIGKAFEDLVKLVPGGFTRSFFGISEMKNGVMQYSAVAEELSDGEAETYQCSEFVIAKGVYLTTMLKDWQTKTERIKDIFHEMMKDNRVDKSKPCIEWYKNEREMLCMVRMK
jgi:hypothetical protein